MRLKNGVKSMQVRLKVQRAHAAILLAIAATQQELEKETVAYEAKIDLIVAKLLTKRTLCGGPKYNEVTARKKAHKPFYGSSYEMDCCNRRLNRLEFMRDKTENKHGFMVLFEDEEYQRFMNFL
jgi:hypothetical protein